MKNNVLVVEDEPDFQKLVKRVLTKKGYEVRIAEDGEEGLRLMEESVAQLVILDLMLPGIDGLAVLKRLREKGASGRVPVLILTAKSEEDDVVEGLSLGADDYLVKPFSPKELIARVERLLSRASKSIGRLSSALLLGLALAGTLVGPVRADEQADVARRLSSELTAMLEQFLGPGKAKVVVAVRGRSSTTESRTEILSFPGDKGGTTRAAAGFLWEQTAERTPVLPGYKSLKDIPKATGPQQRTVRRAVTVPGFAIEQLRVSVVLDRSVPAETVDRLRSMLEGVVGADPSRGDVLEIHQMPMAPAWQRLFSSEDFLRQGFYAACGLSALGALVVLIYLFANRLARNFIESLERMRQTPVRSRETIELGGAGENLPGGPGAETLGLAEPEEVLAGEFEEVAQGEARGEWGFLEKADGKDLAAVMGEEEADGVALLLSHLGRTKPELQPRLFSALSNARQLEVSKAMAELKRLDSERLAEMESRLQERFEGRLKGAEELSRVLSRVAPDQREWVLGELQSRSPETAEEVERMLFTFDHLGDIPDGSLRRLLSSVSYEKWGMALRGMPEEMIAKITGLVPGDIGDMIREFSGKPQAKDKVLAARDEILSLTLQMSGKGELDIGAGRAEAELL